MVLHYPKMFLILAYSSVITAFIVRDSRDEAISALQSELLDKNKTIVNLTNLIQHSQSRKCDSVDKTEMANQISSLNAALITAKAANEKLRQDWVKYNVTINTNLTYLNATISALSRQHDISERRNARLNNVLQDWAAFNITVQNNFARKDREIRWLKKDLNSTKFKLSDSRQLHGQCKEQQTISKETAEEKLRNISERLIGSQQSHKQCIGELDTAGEIAKGQHQNCTEKLGSLSENLRVITEQLTLSKNSISGCNEELRSLKSNFTHVTGMLRRELNITKESYNALHDLYQ